MKQFSLFPLLLCFLLPAWGVIVFPTASRAAALKDAESASHADTAATQVLEAVYEYDGVKILQFNLSVLSHYSYMVVSASDALVVDPDRDVGVYLHTAKKEGWRIKGVFLTHSNADFVAGHTELVKAAGCPVYQHRDSGALYGITPLSDGQSLPWGEIELKFMDTPGHTPDGMSALVFDRKDRVIPRAILTGDTLFVGSIGRPDLMGGAMAAATLAGMAYDTWTNKLSRLDDNVVVLPCHGAGSLCGAHLRDEPSSTIGTERATNPYLRHKSRNDFITAVLEGLPEAPQYFRHNAKMNREGPAPVSWKEPAPGPPALDSSLSDISRYYVVDLRDAKSFARGHIPNAVNIGLRGRLETWVGTMVPWGSKVVLCGSPEEIQEARLRLYRVGYEVACALTFDGWVAAKQPVFTNVSLSPRELHGQVLNGTAPVIVDVRLPEEWMGLRIGNVLNMPLNRLGELAAKLDPREPVVTVCNSAFRSSLGIGLLERRGFRKVASMEGGGEAWIEAGLPVIQPSAPGISPARARRTVRLPDLIDPAQIRRMIMDLPGTFDLVDIRPAPHFRDYRLPGSQNVELADLMDDPAWLTGAGALVIVDRDGSLAMVAGGILSQKTQRPVKVLFGGLSAYWRTTEMGEPVKAVPILPEKAKAQPAVPPVPAPEASPKPVPPKKKSAGC